MSGFQQIKTKHAKSQEKKTQSEEKKPSSEPESNVTQMLNLSDREFKITMINISWILMKWIDTMKVHMGNVSRWMETMNESKGTHRSKKHSDRNEEFLS